MSIHGIVMKNGDILISPKVEKIVPDDYTDPDLEITEPYLVQTTAVDSVYIKRYLGDFTEQKVFSFRRDDILTVFSPKEILIEEYKKETKVEEQLELDIETNSEEELS